MTYQDIILESSNGIATITLNRPSTLNALTPNLIQELKLAIKDVAEDLAIKVLIVKGAGRAFSAGVDLKAMNESIQDGKFKADEILKDGNEIAETMRNMSQPTIALVHGYCFTGATELMMFFDLIIAAEDAQIGDTHAKWGILPKWGMTQRLPRLVGILKAKEMSFTAKPISGKEAERIGLVNRAVPLEDLEKTGLELAKDIMQNSAQTIDAIKHLYNDAQETTLTQGLERENALMVEITDRAEYLKNFEKNKKASN